MPTAQTRRREAAPLVALLALVLAAPLAGCRGGEGAAASASAGTGTGGDDGKKKDGDKEKEKETAVPVEVAAVDRGTIESVLRFSTNLFAEREVEVHAQSARLVREIRVEEGDRVEKDQVLLRLQDEEQRSALAKASILHDKARRELDRLESLYERQMVSEQAFHDARFEHEQRRLALDDARREAGYTEVKAPIAGTITRRLVNVGDLVTAGQHLFDLVDFASLAAPVYVPEKELRRLAPGVAARVSTQAGDRLYRGRVERVTPSVDPKTGTVKVIVVLDEHEGLLPGMYVDVELVTDVHRDALLLPKRAVVYDKDQLYVYRLKGEERRVERVRVEAALEDKEHVEPAAGFEAGERIVVAGQAGLKDGALVRLPGDPEPPRSRAPGEKGAA